MERTVDERRLDVHRREARVGARLERLADPGIDRLDVLARDRAADDLVDELVARPALPWLELDHGVAVLALAAGLADEPAVAVGWAADGLAIRHLRPADVRRDLELADHPVHQDVEMQLAHPGDERLAALGIGLDPERGVFLGEPLQGDAQLVLVGLGLRLDLDLDDRLGERHGLEDHRVVGVGQRVAGVRLLEPDGRGDIARVDLLDLFAVIRVHLEDATDPLLAILGGVVDVRARLERAGVDPEEDQLADERVGRDLERQCAEGLAVVDGAQDLGVGARVLADDRRNVERRGQEVHDRVEDRLDALVAQRRAGEDRHDLVLQGREAKAVQDLGLAQVVAFEELVGQLVVRLRDGFDEDLAVPASLGEHVGRDVDHVDGLAAVVAVQDRLHADQVDDALEALLDADRDLDRHGIGAEPVLDHVDAAPEIGAGAVELVDEADPRHLVAVGLAPDRLGLGLDTGHAVEDHDRAVEHAEAALDLDREVHVPGRIDDVDAMVVPEAGRCSRGDRDPALLLLGHPVHGGRALMDLAELVDLLRVEEDPLGDGGLARVDMGDDSDVPRSCERNVACHLVT